MSAFYEETLQAVGESIFLLPGAQYVTYCPAGGSPRRIQAVPLRGDEADLLTDAAGPRRPATVLLVQNSSTTGIASDDVNTGGDKVEIALRPGAKPVTCRIARLVEHDAAFCKFEIQ